MAHVRFRGFGVYGRVSGCSFFVNACLAKKVSKEAWWLNNIQGL